MINTIKQEQKGCKKQKIDWKQFRKICAIFYFILCILSLFFIFPSDFSKMVYNLQIGPALIRLFKGIGINALLTVLIPILFVFLFGRIYCSILCPLGILQDFARCVGNYFKLGEKPQFGNKTAVKITRISILVVVVGLLLLDSSIAVSWLEPFTIFSRTLFLLKSIVTKSIPTSLIPSIFIGMTIGIIFLTALKKNRFFCIWVCPIGTVLWGISKFSLLKFRINKSTCTNCGKCVAACKTNAISLKNKTVDPMLCVGCFNCLTACKNNSMTFSPPKKVDKNTKNEKNTSSNFPKSRRKFVRQLGSFLLIAVSPSNTLMSHKKKQVSLKIKSKSPVYPPGVKNISHFKNLCTGCMVCAQKCPAEIISFSLDKSCRSGIIPILNFQNNYCLENCVECTTVCPTGALSPLSIIEKKDYKIAKLKINSDYCLNVKDKLECSLCSEICPVNAIKMRPSPDNNFKIPFVNTDICNGCGKCQYRCPSQNSDEIFNFSA